MQWCQCLKADYGMDPQVWQSLDGPSFCLSSNLCPCNYFHGCFVPNSKKGQSDPAIPLLGIYPDVPTGKKDTCSTMFIAALFILARSWKESTCPSTEEWIQKMWFIFTMVIYSTIKNNDFIKFSGKWMKLENIS